MSRKVTHQREPLWLCRRSKCTLGVQRWSQQIPGGPEGERLSVTANQRQLSLSLTNQKPGQSGDLPRGQSSLRGQRWRQGRRSTCCCALPRWRQWRRSCHQAQTPNIMKYQYFFLKSAKVFKLKLTKITDKASTNPWRNPLCSVTLKLFSSMMLVLKIVSIPTLRFDDGSPT